MASPEHFILVHRRDSPAGFALLATLTLLLTSGCGSAQDITFDSGGGSSNPGGNGGSGGQTGGSSSVGGSGTGAQGAGGGQAQGGSGGAGAQGGSGGAGAQGGSGGAGAQGGSGGEAQGGTAGATSGGSSGTGGSAGHGGSGGGPVSVDCLSRSCSLDGNPTSACCFERARDGSSARAACVSGPPENDGCLTTDTDQQTRIECQSNADCPGQVCCGFRRDVNQTAYYVEVRCADSCDSYGPEIPICDPAHGNGECPEIDTQNGLVQLNCVQSQLLPLGYFVCGA